MLRAFFRGRAAQWLLPLVIILILWGSQVVAEVKEGHQTFSFRLLLSEKKCQMAIWLTDEQGVFVDTVYVTRKVAKKGLGNRRGGLDDKWGGARLSALPVWAYSRGIDYGNENFYPPKNKPLPDAITSATPKAGEFVWEWKPKKALKLGKYFYGAIRLTQVDTISSGLYPSLSAPNVLPFHWGNRYGLLNQAKEQFPTGP